MKRLNFAMLALIAGISAARAGELTVTRIGEVETLPCSIFVGTGSGLASLKEGITLTIPLSSTNNSQLFARLRDRLNDCQNSKTDHIADAER